MLDRTPGPETKFADLWKYEESSLKISKGSGYEMLPPLIDVTSRTNALTSLFFAQFKTVAIKLANSWSAIPEVHDLELKTSGLDVPHVLHELVNRIGLPVSQLRDFTPFSHTRFFLTLAAKFTMVLNTSLAVGMRVPQISASFAAKVSTQFLGVTPRV